MKLRAVRRLRLALPTGSMQEATFALFKRAGYAITVPGPRSYVPSVDDPELDCLLLRAQEIPRYVGDGVLDAGLCGLDWLLESGARVVEAADLAYAKHGAAKVGAPTAARWVLAVCAPPAGARHGRINSVRDLEGKRVATELVRVTRQYLRRHGVRARVEYSWGATEVKVPELADAIVELTETGESLRAHGLRIIDTVLETNVKFIAHPAAWRDEWKRQKIENLAVLLLGALQAEAKVGLKMNVASENLQAVLKLLPAMKEPTVSSLAVAHRLKARGAARSGDRAPSGGWHAVETVADEKQVRDLIPQLRRAGAQDIIEYPLNKVIP